MYFGEKLPDQIKNCPSVKNRFKLDAFPKNVQKMSSRCHFWELLNGLLKVI